MESSGEIIWDNGRDVCLIDDAKLNFSAWTYDSVAFDNDDYGWKIIGAEAEVEFKVNWFDPDGIGEYISPPFSLPETF